MRTIAVAGIHTGIGKTVASAIIAEALGADYWKPVQAGELDASDTLKIAQLISNGMARVHTEAVRLTQPLSPHAAAAIDGIEIDHTTFTFPVTENILVVETAGGVHSPISDRATMADFMQHYQLPAVLVSSNYLGSINHTLLSIEVLKKRNIPIIGVIMNGESNVASETFIEQYSGVPIIAHIPQFLEVTHENIVQEALIIQNALRQRFGHE